MVYRRRGPFSEDEKEQPPTLRLSFRTLSAIACTRREVSADPMLTTPARPLGRLHPTDGLLPKIIAVERVQSRRAILTEPDPNASAYQFELNWFHTPASVCVITTRGHLSSTPRRADRVLRAAQLPSISTVLMPSGRVPARTGPKSVHGMR